MNNKLRYAIMAALAMLVIVPIVYNLVAENPQFSVAIMLEVAVIGFSTVVFVMIMGLQEDHYPKAAKDSAAVTAWSQRSGAAQEAEVQETVESIEDVSGDGTSES